jgi:hypothetical protein
MLLGGRSCELCHFSECGSRFVERSDDHELTCAYALEELVDLLGLYRLWFCLFREDDRMASDIDTQRVRKNAPKMDWYITDEWFFGSVNCRLFVLFAAP